MDCVFCDAPVEFGQHKMAHQLFDRSDPETTWWLCRDCADIRERGDRTKRLSGARGTCIDCEEDAAYSVAILLETPGGDVETDGTVFDVLCETHFEERRN